MASRMALLLMPQSRVDPSWARPTQNALTMGIVLPIPSDTRGALWSGKRLEADG
jgi:hypothetical protein